MPVRVLGTVVDFRRAGYPEGVPRRDYIPLLALLRRQLTDDDPDVAASVDHAIREITNEDPLPGDLARVAARLAAGGWPLASLHVIS